MGRLGAIAAFLGADAAQWLVGLGSAGLGALLVAAVAWTLHRRKLDRETASLRRQLDQKRDAEADMRRVNAELEARVDARTQELERSNKELERFAYVASHDLREPLRTVTSYTQLLARRYRNELDGDAIEFIDFAVAGCDRMRQLIHDLLEYSRSGRGRDSIERTSLQDALDRAKKNLGAMFQETGATIEHETLPDVMGTRAELEMLLQNLLANAIRYRSEQPPHIRISASQKDDEVTLCVRDNGIGFDMKHAERIFGVFQRLHGRESYPGTGIGLAICEKIMRSYGGRIWAESAVGRGSAFFCAFPRNPAGAKAAS